MSIIEISPYLTLVLSIIAILGHAKGYFSSGEKTLTARMDKAEKTVIDHDRRIQSVEQEIKHLPSKEAVHSLQLAMTKIEGQIATMSKSSEATERAIRRVEEFLLSRKD